MPACRAFSLAELMIAIVILGLGLLFIAAALPVGLSYTRDTLDLAAGEAASEYALDTIEQYLRTSNDLIDDNGNRLDNFFRPRLNSPPTYPLDTNDPEPWIKVRPLVMTNVVYGPTGGLWSKGDEITYDTENATIGLWFPFANINVSGNETAQYDAVPVAMRLALQPGLPSVARVYPPITPDTPFQAQRFLNDVYDDGVLTVRPVLTPTLGGSETLKALQRRVVWTAFYRRVSYSGDPLLYEVIVVVVRRPSVDHRFPIQNGFVSFDQPLALDVTVPGSEVLAPEPWLVTFDPAVALPPQPPLVPGSDYANTSDRPLLPGFTERPTLRFTCATPPPGQPGLGALLPVGSIFVPAVNWESGTLVGFVPHAPDALPIYEVIERPDETTVVVKNNGFYPWLRSGDARAWPVWVIPPAFRERDVNGQPVYERRSPILTVARRYIRLREID